MRVELSQGPIWPGISYLLHLHQNHITQVQILQIPLPRHLARAARLFRLLLQEMSFLLKQKAQAETD